VCESEYLAELVAWRGDRALSLLIVLCALSFLAFWVSLL
jgi:hypothetical protein